MRHCLLLLLALHLPACGKDEPGGRTPGSTTDGSDGGNDGGEDVVLPGDPDLSWVDELPEGMKDPPENAHGGLDLSFDAERRDAVTAYADCGAWLSGCLEERQGDFGACVAAVPICQTDTPWEEGDCCPSTCQSQYEDAVAAGSSAYDAYITTFALDRSCFPGLQGGEG